MKARPYLSTCVFLPLLLLRKPLGETFVLAVSGLKGIYFQISQVLWGIPAVPQAGLSMGHSQGCPGLVLEPEPTAGAHHGLPTTE